MWIIFKVCWICYTIVSVLCFGHKLCEILLSTLTRDRTHTPALEGEVLTTGLPGKSQVSETSREHFKIWGLL